MPLLSRQDPRLRRLAELEPETEPDGLPARLALRSVSVKPLPLLPFPVKPLLSFPEKTLLVFPSPSPGFELPTKIFFAPPELVDDEAAVELDSRGLVTSSPLLEMAMAETGEVVGFFEGGYVGDGGAGAAGVVAATMGVVVPGMSVLFLFLIFLILVIVITLFLAIRLTPPGL